MTNHPLRRAPLLGCSGCIIVRIVVPLGDAVHVKLGPQAAKNAGVEVQNTKVKGHDRIVAKDREYLQEYKKTQLKEHGYNKKHLKGHYVPFATTKDYVRKSANAKTLAGVCKAVDLHTHASFGWPFSVQSAHAHSGVDLTEQEAGCGEETQRFLCCCAHALARPAVGGPQTESERVCESV